MPLTQRQAVSVSVGISRHAECGVRADVRREGIRRRVGPRVVVPSDVVRLNPLEAQIQEIVQRETRAWDTQDASLLISCFHPAMVWPWPPTARSHDPMTWVMVWGRFDAERWTRGWQELFDTHTLVHNQRETKRIVVSTEGDGAFAVVDIDTLWRHKRTGTEQRWKGRTCKIYSKMGTEWKMVAQTGVLEY